MNVTPLMYHPCVRSIDRSPDRDVARAARVDVVVDRAVATMSRALQKMFAPWIKSASAAYRANVGNELRKYGLRYDDLLDEGQDLDVGEALKRLSAEERDMRQQRLKRAMDLSLKHVYLSKEEQAMQTPFDFYLTPVVEEVKRERAERAALGTTQPYNRQIP